MKKLLTILGTALLSTALLAGCGSTSSTDSNKSANDNTITVAASPSPHAEILEVAKEVLAEQGINLDIKVFNDYVIPNTATESGEVDANYFQHTPFLYQMIQLTKLELYFFLKHRGLSSLKMELDFQQLNLIL